MIARLVKTALWLLVGHALLGGVYWGLLNVPESNVAMLAISAFLSLLLFVGAAVVQATAVRIVAPAVSPRSIAALAASVPAFVIAAVIWLAFSWLAGWLGARHTEHAGEIDAWLIAHGDWTRTAWLHRGIEVVIWILRYVIGVSLAVGFFVTWVLDGVGEAIRPRRFVAALGWKRLLFTAAAIVVLVWLPWRVAYWRPPMSPTFVQPLFAAVKLGLIALIAHIGWALVLWSAVSRVPLTSRRHAS
jgi:hypothetical protein